MTFLRCTCDLAGIQHSFEFLFVVSGLGVEVWLKRCLRAEKGQATRVSMFYPFIFPFFFFQFAFLHYHMYHFFLNSLRFGSRLWKVNIHQNSNLFYHYFFQRTPVLYNFISQSNVFLFVIYFHYNNIHGKITQF